jgi:rRNA maturation endonuclease Nob1
MAQRSDKVICENCGEQYDRDQGETCPSCGAKEPLETDIDAERRPKDMVKCENCGEQYDRDQGETCPSCGAKEPLESGI